MGREQSISERTKSKIDELQGILLDKNIFQLYIPMANTSLMHIVQDIQ
jgi:hypothetical protein